MKKAKLFDIRKLPMDMARLVCWPLLPWYRMQRLTPEGAPYRGTLHGPAIIAANHTDFEDPFLVGVAFWYRRMYFLAAEAVMAGKKLRKKLLQGAGVIEIDRTIADIEAIRKAVKVLKEGHLLAIFPEGGIQEGGDVQAVKGGCILMAVQADVPIIPMHIQPKEKWYRRRRVVIGTPICPKDYFTKKFPTTADLDRAADALMAEMNRCGGKLTQEETV